jgi:hypothetical protein
MCTITCAEPMLPRLSVATTFSVCAPSAIRRVSMLQVP